MGLTKNISCSDSFVFPVDSVSLLEELPHGILYVFLDRRRVVRFGRWLAGKNNEISRYSCLRHSKPQIPRNL